MSAAVSLEWASAGPASKKTATPRARRQLRAVKPPEAPRYFAVECMVCEFLGPLAPQQERGFSPAKRSGWRFMRISQLEGWVCPDCFDAYQSLLPPPTRGDCIEGPRPCPHKLCKWHLCGDASRKASKDFAMPESCALDVVDRNDEGMTLSEIGAVLGMTREGSRYVLLNARFKLLAIPGLGWDFDDDDDNGDDE